MRDPMGPYHLRDSVEPEVFIERDIFYSSCTAPDCQWKSPFDFNRQLVVSSGLQHAMEMENLGLGRHPVIVHKQILLIEADNPIPR